MKRSWYALGLYSVVGVVFAYAGVIKIADTEQFLGALLTYELFPHSIASILAIYLPWLEALIGASLISGLMRKGGELLAWLMLIAFLASIGQAWARGLSIDCGCFGESKVSSAASDYLTLIVRDLALIAALWMARTFRSRNQ